MFSPGKQIEKWVPKEIWQNAHPSQILSKTTAEVQWLATLAQSYLHPRVMMLVPDKYPPKLREYAERRCREIKCDEGWVGPALLVQNPKALDALPQEVETFLEDFVTLCFRYATRGGQ